MKAYKIFYKTTPSLRMDGTIISIGKNMKEAIDNCGIDLELILECTTLGKVALLCELDHAYQCGVEDTEEKHRQQLEGVLEHLEKYRYAQDPIGKAKEIIKSKLQK